MEKNLAGKKDIMSFYKEEILPILPSSILDFHAHIWSSKNWNQVPWRGNKKGSKYMVTTPSYPPEKLLKDACECFPYRNYHAVCFGYPVPVTNWEKDTTFVAEAASNHKQFFPLVLGGKPLGISYDVYKEYFNRYKFYGFKVFLPWYGDNYGTIKVNEMIGNDEIRIANERKLVILLHVPGKRRLADKVVQRGVTWLAKSCSNAFIVLAHCGRCYLPQEMKDAINSIENLSNVYMDASMVMDPVVFQMVIDAIGPARLFYATDFPVAAMKGKRVSIMDHWVDVVLPGNKRSAYRVCGAIRAVPMAWEIILGIKWAAYLCGISKKETQDIFWNNGMSLLLQVKR